MDYVLEEQVGLGTFGKVYRARNKYNHRLYALKRVKMESEREGFPVTAVREAKLLESLKHENIICLEQIIHSEEQEDGESGVFFVFPYCEYDLVGLMRKKKLLIDEIRFILYSILHGLAYMHSNGIVHRDVKPSNVLISHDGRVCLGDFGLAKSLRSPDYNTLRPLTNRVVTLWYRPPELLLGSTRYDGAVDIWATGCILYEMLGDGSALFFGNDEFTVLEAIVKRLGPLPDIAKALPWHCHFQSSLGDVSPIDLNFDRQARDLLLKMLIVDPRERISAERALKHPFLSTVRHSFRIGGLSKKDSQHEFEVKRLEE
jgi:cyclin-dependent kinase 12/13